MIFAPLSSRPQRIFQTRKRSCKESMRLRAPKGRLYLGSVKRFSYVRSVSLPLVNSSSVRWGEVGFDVLMSTNPTYLSLQAELSCIFVGPFPWRITSRISRLNSAVSEFIVMGFAHSKLQSKTVHCHDPVNFSLCSKLRISYYKTRPVFYEDLMAVD